MRHIIVLTLLLFLSNLKVLAQKEANNWYFSDQAGLSFNSATPIALTIGALAHPADGCTTASNANGNLLFYSNGVTVWNRNHIPMPNGYGLMGHLSSSQSVVAVPKPGSGTIYYLFTVDAIENNLSGGLRYSVLDMSLANGFGDITIKNVLLETPVTENLTATKHANGIDYWIITHRWNSNAYTAYLLTGNGVITTPVVSNAGVNVQGTFLNATGVLKASPDGTKLGHGIRDLQRFQLLDFNKSTGVINNAIISVASYPLSVGVEFSPDGTKMYCSAAGTKSIYQFDLTAPNIFGSGILIGSPPFATTHMQIGPDGKIYCSQRDSNFLGVINNPNNLGALCNYANNGVYLGGKKNWFALPNFPTNLFKSSPGITFNFSNGCFGEKIIFSIPSFQSGMSATWNFGDPNSGSLNSSTSVNPSHTFSASGNYQVTLVVLYNGAQTVITKNVVVKPAPKVNLGNDTSLCIGSTLLLGSLPIAGYSYKWQDGSDSSTYLVNKSGTYILEVSHDGCRTVDSIHVTYNIENDFSLGNDTLLCDGESILLGKKAIPGYIYHWQDGSTASTYLANKSGIYTLEAYKDNCDKLKVDIKIDYKDCSLFIPNIISPNQDGLNDAFILRGLISEEFQLQIYNRWGTQVYEINTYKNDWKGQDVSSGAYYYLLRNNQNGVTYKGWLEVVK